MPMSMSARSWFPRRRPAAHMVSPTTHAASLLSGLDVSASTLKPRGSKSRESRLVPGVILNSRPALAARPSLAPWSRSRPACPAMPLLKKEKNMTDEESREVVTEKMSNNIKSRPSNTRSCLNHALSKVSQLIPPCPSVGAILQSLSRGPSSVHIQISFLSSPVPILSPMPFAW
ncbi:hypothetical protein B0T10DRAFT_66482 [Thelonectria olida]|uniref:Uncharacterized protein n=1 Tax=Thelonectria olida TaxID=1576542 RepID=A0A9P8W305_9HYPO|nr:hypothetical protein B0T10DRAFT_66482 [Thelonectria olida]